MRLLSAALAASLLASAMLAHDYTSGNITIGHPFSYETISTARTAGGFLSITNAGDTPDRLIAVEAPVERVELHRTEQDANGVNRMVEQEGGVVIPAGETVTFEHGSWHVMFFGLPEGGFGDGDRIEAVLVFEQAGEIPVIFNVEARGGGHDRHGDHDEHEAGMDRDHDH
ncbi:copper chaperone PCu(A)C [Roseobacter sp. HKCCA0434]|uniref:copper chaperone PCu(A)C n=1 Tax=Roseobacter sp. HKCCA0434 TaxID=3079297 RepID=UPI002905A5B6|nr:copper chaperone PCu(A)C [Roseobacter sp. HKCCA0434]